MAVVVVACLIGLVAVALALLRDRPLADRLRAPDWDPLPAPVDVARVDFPLAFPGYDPATVELTLETLNDAYADLLAVAPPAVVERARRRAALRAGREPAAAVSGPRAPGRWSPVPGGSDDNGNHENGSQDNGSGDNEALRTEAALAAVGASAPARGAPATRRSARRGHRRLGRATAAG